MTRCPKCAEIMASPAKELVLFWSPGQSDSEIHEQGERIRVEAVALHASAGHPLDPKEYPGRPWWKPGGPR